MGGGLTLRSCVSMPGKIMITDTSVPRRRKKEKISRVTVELLEEGQQPQRRHGAEPHKHEACNMEGVRERAIISPVQAFMV